MFDSTVQSFGVVAQRDTESVAGDIGGAGSKELFAHQREAVNLFKDAKGFALFFEMGCVSGNTIIRYNTISCPVTVSCSLFYFFETFHDRQDVYRVRGLVDGVLGDVTVRDVLDKGVQDCLEVVTEDGYSLQATPDHELLLAEGAWAAIETLHRGDMILCNGMYSITCPVCGETRLQKTYIRNDAKYPGWCMSCVRREINFERRGDVSFLSPDGYVMLLGPQTKDFKHLRTRGGVPEHRMVMEKLLGRKLVQGEAVHHVDGNKENNSPENLELLSGVRRHVHRKPVTIVPVASKINYIRRVGKQHVYDIVCEEPHNFVANGIIVHNCGKSATTLKIVEHKVHSKELDALLIIAPNRVHYNSWYRVQLPMWLDVPYEAQCLFGEEGAKKFYDFGVTDKLQVVCINIDTFSTKTKWLQVAEWANSRRTFIVLDESTCIKHWGSQRTQNILYGFNKTKKVGRRIQLNENLSAGRAILTGTPVTNSPLDLYTMGEFMIPGFWDMNWYAFQSRYGMFTSLNVNGMSQRIPLTEKWWTIIKGIKDYDTAAHICGCSVDTFNTVHSQDVYRGAYKNIDELKKKLEGYALFKKLVDCNDMPPQNYVTRKLTMNPEIAKCYNSMRNEYVAQFKEHNATALNKLTLYIRLQQISSGFICDKGVFDRYTDSFVDKDVLPSDIQWIGKSNPKLDMLYNDVAISDKPVIIVTKYTAEAARIYADLKDKYVTCLMTGWKKVGTIEEFQAGQYDVMVANTGVIARGLDLQNSHTLLCYSNTFSLETRLQIEGRIFRLGQKQPCLYIDYSYEGTIDEQIIQVLLLRKNVLEYIRAL